MSAAGILSTPRRILANIRALTMSHAYGAAVNLLLPILLVKLGVESTGVYLVGQVLFVIFRVFSDFGATTLAIRDVARRSELLGTYHRPQLVLRLAASLACGGFIFGLVAVARTWGSLASDDAFVIRCFALAIVLDTLAEGYRYSFRALQLMEREAAVNAIERSSLLVLTIVSVLATSSIRAPAAAFVLAQAVNAVTARLLARPVLPARTPWDGATFRHLVRFGPGFFGMQASYALYNRIDMILLYLMATKLEVGLYGLAYYPLKGLLMVPEVSMMALFPAFAELHLADVRKLESAVRRSFRYLVGATTAVALAVAFSSDLVVRLMLMLHKKAEDTSALGLLITVLILSAPLYTVTSISGHIMAATGRQVRLSGFYVAALTFNVVANAAFAIPRWGALGCAGVTVATEALLSVALVQSLPDVLDRALRVRAAALATATCAVAVLFAMLP